jgi:hypothetical protein
MSGDAVQEKAPTLAESVPSTKPFYSRVLIKISGEALMGAQEFGVDPSVMEYIALQIKEVYQLGVEIAVVVGGGNIIRGVKVSQAGFDRATGDYMGMLATVINSLALQNALEKIGIFTRVLSAIHMAEVAEPFIRRRAIRHLEKKANRYFRSRHRESLFFNRYGRRFAGNGDQGRDHSQGHQGGRRLRLRPGGKSRSSTLRESGLLAGSGEGSASNGQDCHYTLYG